MDYSQPISIYFHIPFCIKKCGYCDFNSYAGKERLIPLYVDCLIKEMRSVIKNFHNKHDVQTVFFGGGTPSLLSVDNFKKIFDTLGSLFNVNPDSEISLEVNPGTVDLTYLRKLKSIGFNRISFGVQSTNVKELQMLGRIHSKEEIFRSWESARIAGFSNLNIDLIYGLPDQTIDNWKSNILDILNLVPEHISLYALSIEKNTRFGSRAKTGLIKIPDPDLAAEMYEWSSDTLEKADFRQYEISNWSKKGFECRHNLQIWRNLNYIGFGAGAHGFIKNIRLANAQKIGDYIKRINNYAFSDHEIGIENISLSPANVSRIPISRFENMQETLMLGLRLINEGVSNKDFHKRFEVDLMDIFRTEILELTELELLDWDEKKLKLTSKGRLLSNQVFMRFVN